MRSNVTHMQPRAVRPAPEPLALYLRAGRNDPDAGIFARLWWASAVLYAVIAVVGVAPELARTVGLTPLQAEATMLILLVAIAHAVAWEFMTRHVSDDTYPE